MKIIFDGMPLINAGSGIGQYTFNLLWQFNRLGSRNEYYMCGVNNFIRKVNCAHIANETEYGEILERLTVRIPFPFKKITRILMKRYTHTAIKFLDADLFWGTGFFGHFNKSFKTIITIHDMAYKHYPETIHQPTYRELIGKLQDHAQKSHAIIAVSNSTKRDIVHYLGVPPEKVWVIYNGVNSRFCQIRNQGLLNTVKLKYRLPEKFILFVGTLEPRKNIIGLIEAFKKLTLDPHFKYQLVIVGSKGWGYKPIFSTAESLGIKDRIIFAGYVPGQDLPAIYNLAGIFVYPSFYEGFGIPVVEAMACGTPVITSNVSSLPEVGGDAVLYVDPKNIEEISTSIKGALSDENLSQTLREKGVARSKEFSWEYTARQTLDVFKKVM
jgi:glycosyltransferase involved in cell wall biosynthesis